MGWGDCVAKQYHSMWYTSELSCVQLKPVVKCVTLGRRVAFPI